jgi:hypothetical protein
MGAYRAWEDQYEKAESASQASDSYLHQTHDFLGTVNSERQTIDSLTKSLFSVTNKSASISQNASDHSILVAGGTVGSISTGDSNSKNFYQSGPLVENNVYQKPSDIELPLTEGLEASAKQIPSPDPSQPYAVMITIQVHTDVSPFGIGLVCDKPITGKYEISNFYGIENVEGDKPLINSPYPSNQTYGVSISDPPITPQRPLIIRIFGKEPFKIIHIARL